MRSLIEDKTLPLIAAVQSGCVKQVEAILKTNIDINATDAQGVSALEHALLYLRVLLIPDNENDPEFNYQSIVHYGKIVILLFEHGANFSETIFDARSMLKCVLNSLKNIPVHSNDPITNSTTSSPRPTRP